MSSTKQQPQHPELGPMAYVNSALFNALYSGLSLQDVCNVAENAATPEAFDHAVNLLAQTVPAERPEQNPEG